MRSPRLESCHHCPVGAERVECWWTLHGGYWLLCRGCYLLHVGAEPPDEPEYLKDSFVPGELRIPGAGGSSVESRSRVHARGATEGGYDARLPAPTPPRSRA